jgi:hypothetical protein
MVSGKIFPHPLENLALPDLLSTRLLHKWDIDRKSRSRERLYNI